MTHLVALDASAHRNLRVLTEQVEEQGADLHMVPVARSEFLKLVVQFPILFSKNADTGQFLMVALMGLEEGENLFWQAGEMQTVYTPLSITRHPFFVGQDEQSGENHVICIDEDSSLLSEEEGERLFNEDGSATALLETAQQRLAQLLDGERDATEFLQTLTELNLLVPLSLDITYADGSVSKINGLYSIDEDKLAALDGDTVASLHRSGYLQSIHTQLASLGQIYALIERKNTRNAQVSPWLKAAQA